MGRQSVRERLMLVVIWPSAALQEDLARRANKAHALIAEEYSKHLAESAWSR